MANAKKVIIKKEDLPSFNVTDQSYSIRYRIVSEDKNRSSHWSPYYHVAVPSKNTPEDQVQCAVSVVDTAVSMVWTQPAEYNAKLFDIYFKLDEDDWEYVSSSSSTQFSTLIPSSVISLMVAIQVPTYPKKYSLDAAIFTSTPIVV